jgi:hypothetical protein
MRGFLGVAFLVVGVTAGCTRTFHGGATQPNPLVSATETLRTSERITIPVSGLGLEQPDAPRDNETVTLVHNHHYMLQNAASFTVVTRDRLRFHVQLDHNWEDYADLSTWRVELVDDKGRSWTPEEITHRRTRLLTSMWDTEQRTALCDGHGRTTTGDCFRTVGYSTGATRNKPLGSITVFRGTADAVFYERGLFTSDVKALTLRLKRSGEVLEFTWTFSDTVASQP